MTMSAAIMGVGAVGAMLPLLLDRGMTRSMILAHASMAVLMIAMVFGDVPRWMHLMLGIVLFGQAFHLIERHRDLRSARFCAIDLTATAALLLSMRASGTPGTLHTAHQHGASGNGTAWGSVLILVCWCLATLLVARSNRTTLSKGAVLGSLLMILGMAPMAV